ncbi:IS66 family insertion sequence element accessory protein TnpB, partial [Escherichia coli]|nr:IS66 family insertion sequence element accessory protein TnpB [Escherichia coli]EJN3790402.1 IS66 family insertion sequence element accessory protein TnpB [Escherichia coli]
MADGRPLSDEPVTLFLPGGIRMCCQPSQLTDVFRALRHADA